VPRVQVHRSIEKTLSDDFQQADTLKMLQVKHTIDFGSSGAGARHARPTDSFYLEFYLDFLSIVSKPGRPTSRRNAPILDSVTVSFQKWAGTLRREARLWDLLRHHGPHVPDRGGATTHPAGNLCATAILSC